MAKSIVLVSKYLFELRRGSVGIVPVYHKSMAFVAQFAQVERHARQTLRTILLILLPKPGNKAEAFAISLRIQKWRLIFLWGK